MKLKGERKINYLKSCFMLLEVVENQCLHYIVNCPETVGCVFISILRGLGAGIVLWVKIGTLLFCGGVYLNSP